MWKADTNINFYENLLEQKENGQIKAIEFNFSTICLLCLKNLLKNQSVNLLSKEVNISTEISQLNLNTKCDAITIEEMLLDVMGKNHVQANSDDNFPQQICAKCLECLKVSYFFKSQSFKTQNVLEKLLLASGKPIRSCTKQQENEIQIESIDLEHSFSVQDKSAEMESIITVEKIVQLPKSVDNSNLKFLDDNNHQILQINTLENENLNNLETRDVEVEYLEYSNPFDDAGSENLFVEDSGMDYEFTKSESDETENEKIKVDKDFEEAQLLNSQSGKSVVTKSVCKSPDVNISSVLKMPKSDGKVESIFKCPGCETVLKSKNSLRNHIILHHPKSKYFNCDDCDRYFRTLQSLERHLKCHQNDVERKMCNYCSKSFLRADDLRRHERVHTNERPFACKWPSCNKSFKQSSELSTHLSVHSKTEFKCNFCDKIFRSRYGIYFHKKKHLQTP